MRLARVSSQRIAAAAVASHGADLSLAVPSLSVVIPTYNRSRILLDTCSALFALSPLPLEFLIVDQTKAHDRGTSDTLLNWDKEGRIRWIQLSAPSIARAMNTGLVASRGDLVLFLDDDIVPEKRLFEAHLAAHVAGRGEVVAGRVLQPWDKKEEGSRRVRAELSDFNFTSDRGCHVDQFMGGNVSMKHECALAVGGVDENFTRVAYRFERELADRFVAAGYRIWYEPTASIEHLKAPAGGTRSYGRRWVNPGHGVGEYYYVLRSSRVERKMRAVAGRLYRSVANRYHAHRPWMVPLTVSTELVAMCWASVQYCRGPRLIGNQTEVVT